MPLFLALSLMVIAAVAGGYLGFRVGQSPVRVTVPVVPAVPWQGAADDLARELCAMRASLMGTVESVAQAGQKAAEGYQRELTKAAASMRTRFDDESAAARRAMAGLTATVVEEADRIGAVTLKADAVLLAIMGLSEVLWKERDASTQAAKDALWSAAGVQESLGRASSAVASLELKLTKAAGASEQIVKVASEGQTGIAAARQVLVDADELRAVIDKVKAGLIGAVEMRDVGAKLEVLKAPTVTIHYVDQMGKPAGSEVIPSKSRRPKRVYHGKTYEASGTNADGSFLYRVVR